MDLHTLYIVSRCFPERRCMIKTIVYFYHMTTVKFVSYISLLNCQRRHSTTAARSSGLPVDERYEVYSAVPAGWSRRSLRDVLQDGYNQGSGGLHFR